MQHKQTDWRSSAARRVAVTGLLGALALALSFLEGVLPPIPVLPLARNWDFPT